MKRFMFYSLSIILLLAFGTVVGAAQYSETFNGMTTGQRIGEQTGWYDAGSGSPVINASNGVLGSKGLDGGSAAFTWTAHSFNWNDPGFTSVTLGMDFQSSASSTFDDDRVCWTVNNASADSRYEFGVQLDNADGNNITTYWRSVIAEDTRIQTPIVALTGINPSSWYRLRATITKLTSTSASIDVSLQALDGGGNPTGTPITGTVPSTSTWAGGVPDNGYFTPTSMWPAYKNHSALAGYADNAYFAEGPGPDFSLILLPDIQNMTEFYPTTVLNSMTQWIANNKTSSNIAFVTATGDLVNSSSSTAQWTSADAAFDILDAASVSYSVGPGNHDLGGLYETYFGVPRFTGKSWYGGHYGSDNLNNYSLFSASGYDFIVINLQYTPSGAILDWADALLKANSTRRGIVVQHDILDVDNSWVNQAAYTALKDNPNLFLMLCGHMHTPTDGAAYRAELGDDSHTIHIVQADYQDFTNGGNGWLRILRFSPADDMIYMTTYSPYTLGNIATDPDQKNLVYVLNGGSGNSAPVALNVNITGTPTLGQVLTANYTYSDGDGDLEGTSTFRWLRNDVAIGGATASTYTLVAGDVGAVIKCEVTPVAATGTSPGSAAQSAGVGPVGDGTTLFTETFNGMTATQRIGQQPGWVDDGTGPLIQASIGVNGSQGIATGNVFAWLAHPFNWNDAGLTQIKLGMDFQSSSAGTFDDDRLAWSISNSDMGSANQFGVQLDNVNDGGIATFWRDGSGTRIQTAIVALSGITADTWYRFRATITKLSGTSASIDVSLQALDGSGNPTGTPITGTVPNTSTWSGGAPATSYFTPTTMWAAFKNYTGVTGASDNAYFEIVSGPVNYAPTATNVNITGTPTQGQVLTANYTYGDAEGDLQGATTFRWLRDNVAIGGATANTYTLVSADVGTTIKCEVTPVALTGTLVGTPVQSAGVGPVEDPSVVTLVAQGAVWKYLDNGSNQGTAWTGLAFSDGAWASGPAELGYNTDGTEPAEATVVSYGADPNNKYVTTYFRRSLSVADPSTFASLQLRLLRDDGAIVYINGTEVYRTNMPDGAATYTTLASAAISGTDETTFLETTIPGASLVAGNNVVAVELHQSSVTSTDISFDLSLKVVNAAPTVTNVNITGTPTAGQVLTANYTYADAESDAEGATTYRWLRDDVAIGGATAKTYTLVTDDIDAIIKCEVTPVALTGKSPGIAVQSSGVGPVADPSLVALIAQGADWKYLDNGSNQGTAWTGLAFNDAAWASGPAELGYNTDGTEPAEATVVSYGSDANNKYVTTYFRRTFAVANAAAIATLQLRLLRDDGAIVYINGTEVYRTNMPAGAATYTTLASAAISGTDETTFLVAAIPVNALVTGSNVLAVELHQSSLTSTDISFNLALNATNVVPTQKLYVSVTGSDVTGNGTEGNPFRTIAKGVTTAGSGDTVQVKPGAYVEAVNINKSLVLLGSGSATTTIEAPADFATNSAYNYALTNFTTERAIVHVGMSSSMTVKISGFTIDGKSLGPNITQGVAYSALLAEQCNVTVTGNVIKNMLPASGPVRDPDGLGRNGRGIHVRGSGAVATIDGNTLQEINRIYVMINATDNTGQPPAVFPQAVVSNNILTGKGQYGGGNRGIWFNTGAWGEIAGNTITNMDYPDPVIEPDRASGIVVRFGEVDPTHHRVIRNNTLTAGSSVNNKGMYVQGMRDNVFDNTITGFRWGIELHDGKSASVLRNTITGGIVGVLVTSEATAGSPDSILIGGSPADKNTITGQNLAAGGFAISLGFRDPLDPVTFQSSVPVDARFNDLGAYTKSEINARIWDRADTTLINGLPVDIVLFYPYYSPFAPYTISGNAGVSGATLSYTDVTPKTATADGSGNYTLNVNASWSGTVTPSKSGYSFTPPSRTYVDVVANSTGQDYVATFTPSPGWTAYNDVVYRSSDQTIGPNVTQITIGEGNPGPTTGGLLKQSDGTSTGVTATLTQSGTVNWQPDATTGGDNPDPGTDAYTTFCGLMDLGGVVYYGSSSNDWYVDLTLTGLDPTKTYTFATTAVRNDPTYTDRYSKYTLSGATSFTSASTAGVSVPSPEQAIFNTGDNSTEGYVARWTNINPGPDGSIVIRAQAADPVAQYKAYAFSVFMLQEAAVVPGATANLKAILQGPYVAVGDTMSSMMKLTGLVPIAHPYGGAPWNYAGLESVTTVPVNVVDWVLVDLRTGTASSTTVATRAGFIKKDGSIVDLDGTSALNFAGVGAGSYYVVVRHRNHLGVMSANPVPLSGASALYDFTTGVGQYSGSDAASLGGGKYGLWCGDADASGGVDANDRNATWNGRNQTGYLLPDVDLSGDIASGDRNITWNNRNKSTQVP